jgi:hypothetical protein
VSCAKALAREAGTIGMEIRAVARMPTRSKLAATRCRHRRRWPASRCSSGAQVMSQAGAREVLASATVRDLKAGAGLGFEPRVVHALEGVPREWMLQRAVDARSSRAGTGPTSVPLPTCREPATAWMKRRGSASRWARSATCGRTQGSGILLKVLSVFTRCTEQGDGDPADPRVPLPRQDAAAC